MQPSYRAIFTEMLLAQSAAIGAFADVAARCAQLTGQQYQQALVTLARKMPSKDEDVDAASAHPSGESRIPTAASMSFVDFGRAFAGLPRVSTMMFLSRYDNLRGRRSVVRDCPMFKTTAHPTYRVWLGVQRCQTQAGFLDLLLADRITTL